MSAYCKFCDEQCIDGDNNAVCGSCHGRRTRILSTENKQMAAALEEAKTALLEFIACADPTEIGPRIVGDGRLSEDTKVDLWSAETRARAAISTIDAALGVGP